MNSDTIENYKKKITLEAKTQAWKIFQRYDVLWGEREREEGR